MKKIMLLFFLVTVSLAEAQETYTTKKGEVHLLGNIDLDDLRQAPYDEWFKKPSDTAYKLRYAAVSYTHLTLPTTPYV